MTRNAKSALILRRAILPEHPLHLSSAFRTWNTLNSGDSAVLVRIGQAGILSYPVNKTRS